MAAAWLAAWNPLFLLVFHGMCHQLPERSFAFAGHPLGVCARCLGIYAGIAAGALVRWRGNATWAAAAFAANAADAWLSWAGSPGRFLLGFCLALAVVRWALPVASPGPVRQTDGCA